jgi:hypothetical protein
MRKAFLVAGVCTTLSAVVTACMTRPLTSTEPHTSNLYVAPAQNEVIDKIDLLFMIDNSASMGDKQKLLAKAVPQLVNRLVVPRCVGAMGAIQKRTSLTEACPAGMHAEFRAVKDIHVAVITSSLGAHGASPSACGPDPKGVQPPENDDHAHLLPSVRGDLASYNGSNFLAWDPDQKLVPPGENDATRFGTQFGDMVTKAGEIGCGYEASLEAWYRFLIDPEPPLSVTVDGDHSVAQGSDEELLTQRRAFLRSDSLVSIVMLTDENDCSIRDDGSGFWLANSGHPMPRPNSACARDPNDPCCAPCQLGTQPGCASVADDPACKLGNLLDKDEDSPYLRCLENKRRFGYDFLYPTSRYINALTQAVVPKRSTGELVPNPLFAAEPGKTPRNQGLVYLAGIVGVPWQDVADDASLAGSGLRYLTAAELSSKQRWNVLVGDPAKNQPPGDPFMHESPDPRSGKNPVTGDEIVPATSPDPQASPINGHEQVNVDDTDLQYACTFRLSEPDPCTDGSCDCAPGDVATRNSPLCQPPTGGVAARQQYFGKAYPGLRPLEVLRGIGDSAIVASICPKVLTDGQPGYGYEPAVDAIVDRLKIVLNGQCLPRPLAASADASGKLPCKVVEASQPPTAGSCSCNGGRREAATPEERNLVKAQLRDRGTCGTSTTPSCDAFCFCDLAEAEGPALEQCLNDPNGADTPGYCYVDPFGDTPRGNPDLVANCDSSSKRLIRFVGPDTPTPGATAFVACLGAPLN